MKYILYHKNFVIQNPVGGSMSSTLYTPINPNSNLTSLGSWGRSGGLSDENNSDT